MKESVKKLWVNALRSERYEQGKNYLRIDNKFCCLGVLCDIYRLETENDNWELVNNYNYEFLGCSGFLPKDVCEWADINTDPFVFYLNNKKAYLTTLNDIGVTFKEVAELIDRSL